VSLVLTGGVTLSLFKQLDVNNAQQELDLNVIRYKQLVMSTQCQARIGCVADPSELVGILNQSVALNRFGLGGDRLLLLQGPPTGETTVIFDSQGSSLLGSSIPIQGNPLTVSGSQVYPARISFGGVSYMLAASYVGSARSLAPYQGWVVLARPLSAVEAEATSQLLPPILAAGIAGLLLAVVVTMLISRAMTRPLAELELAARDVAEGNYSRRVTVGGGSEIGIVGDAFNEMAAAVERAREMQRRFLADVSHELKTPLTSLIGFSQALVDDSPLSEAERHRAATILHEEAERVLRMSQELLDLARVESGELHIDTQAVDVAVQVEQEVALVRQRAESRRLVLRVSLGDTLPPAEADPERLHQILENLLDNAVKYAPEASIIGVEAEVRGARIEMSVRNRVGGNVPDPVRIFDRFYRADPSRSSAAGGVGLGLAISKRLATAQEGDLQARLEAGDLIMTLSLPVRAEARPNASSAVRSTVRLLWPHQDSTP